MTTAVRPSSRKQSPATSPRRKKPATRHASPRPGVGFAFDRTKGEQTWLTPRWLVDALDLPRTADVDPCAPPVRHWATARRHFNKSEDGFNRPWRKTDFYWVNPPYGRECPAWMGKLADHGNGLLLVFARTDTVAFQDTVFSHPNTSGLFFFRGRLKFANADGEEVGTAGAPSALIAYGKNAVASIRKAIRAGALDGHLLALER
jgi:hypothetical protein